MAATTSAGAGQPEVRRARRAAGVRFVLLLVALIPMVGLLTLAVLSTRRLTEERAAADRLDDHVDELAALIDARAAAANEEVAASVLAIAADLGATPAEVTELYGVDFVEQLAEARAAVDGSEALATLPEVADELQAFRALRPGVDRGEVSFSQLHRAARGLTTAIDEVWADRANAEARRAADDQLPSVAYARLDALAATYLVLSSGADRAALTSFLIRGEPSEEDLGRLTDATGAFRASLSVLPGRVGPAATKAWNAHLADPASQRFEALLDDTLRLALAGQTSPLADDIQAFGDAYIDGPAWAAGLTATVQGAARDLTELADDHAQDATRALQLRLAVVGVLAAAAAAAIVIGGRVVARPLEHLQEAAHLIHEGHFALTPVDVRGPRELADTARAFNDMASTLAGVEAQAMALASDPDAPVTGEQLPGRTGRALQVALNRVRTSMLAAEEHRRQLEQAATHDGLTGLLNRTAGLEMVAKGLSVVEREGGALMALFIDLDGLKEINDTYGHAVGDDALRLAADALREATRAADVVARLGGDEFLVAGVYHDLPAEAEALAERIRGAIGAKILALPDQDIPLRCSIGIARAGAATTVESLVAAADAALYDAKRAGRDQVAWSPTGDDQLMP